MVDIMNHSRFIHKIRKNYPEFYDIFRNNKHGLFEFFEERMGEKYYIHLKHYVVTGRDEVVADIMRTLTYRLLQEEEYIRFKLLL